MIVGVFLVLLSMAAFVFGLVNVVKPTRWKGLTRRRHGAAIIGGSFVAFIVGLAIIGVTAPPVDDPGAGLAEKANAPTVDKGAPPPAGMTQAEFNGVWTQIKSAMAPCDAQVSAAGAALSRGDAYGAYPIVSRARETCMYASSAVTRVDLPRSVKGDARKALDEGRDACSMAMFLKRQAMGAVLKVVDGDNRPSAVSAAQSEMQDAGRQTMACILAMSQAATASELALPELEDAMKEVAAEDAAP